MRLQVLSDLHIEFAPIDLPMVDADVTILAGDIGLRMQGLEWAKRAFPERRVVYIAGNHEYYGASIPQLTDKLRAQSAGSNVSFLDEAEVVIAGVRFLGATLWTDFSLFGPEQRDAATAAAQLGMNDFRHIRKSPSYRKLRASDTIILHDRARTWLHDSLARPFAGRTVVVTHYAPTRNSITERYKTDLLSAAFATHLPELLDGRASLWIHGHTHSAVDDRSMPTRVVSNQRGYPHEPAAGFDPGLVIEI